MTLLTRRAPPAVAAARRVRVAPRPTSHEMALVSLDGARPLWRDSTPRSALAWHCLRHHRRDRRTSQRRLPARPSRPHGTGDGSQPERPQEELAAGNSARSWRRWPPLARPCSALLAPLPPGPSDLLEALLGKLGWLVMFFGQNVSEDPHTPIPTIDRSMVVKSQNCA